MTFDNIFKEGLDEVLCIVRELPSYSPTKLKKEEFQIIKYDVDFILFQLQEYLKNLPKPGIRLLPRHRIVIYNARLIFKGISILFDVHIKYITKLYTNWIKDWERQLSNDFSAVVRKPRPKTAKKKKLHPIAGVTQIDMEEPEAIERNLRTEETARDSFIAMGEKYIEFADRAAAFESHLSQLLPEQALDTDLPAPDLLRLDEGLPELTQRHSETSALDLRRSQVKLSLPRLDDQPYDVSHLRLPLVEQPMDVEISQIPKALQISFEHLTVDFDEIIQNIGKSSTKERSKSLAKSKLIFFSQPFMTSEKYAKILERERKVAGPVKFYTMCKDGSFDPKFIRTSVKEIIDGIIIDHGLHLLEQFEQNVSEPVIRPDQRGQHFPKTGSGMIPEFELPSVDHTGIRDDVPRPEVFGRSMVIHDDEMTINEQPLGQSSLKEVSIRDPSGTEDIDSRLSHLMNNLSLRHIDRIPMSQPLELSQLPDVDHISSMPSLQRPVDEGQPRIQETPQQSSYSLETVEEILIKITEKCIENNSPYIRFTDLCSLSETRFTAAIVFIRLLELSQKKQITLVQNSSHPNDIFITMI